MNKKFYELAKTVWGDQLKKEDVKRFYDLVNMNFAHFTEGFISQKYLSNYMEAFISSMDDLVFELNSEGYIINAWAADESVFWMEREQFMYKRTVDYMPSPIGEKLLAAALEVQQTGKPLEVEYGSPYNDRIFIARFNVIKAADPDKRHISVLIKDITEKKKAQQELLEAKQAAEEALKVKSNFLSAVSHEIRTPMNAIIGFTDLLLEREFPEEVTDYLKSIKHSSENLLVLINDILSYGRLDAGKIELEQIPFDLYNQMEELQKMFEIRAQKKKVHYSVKLEKNVPRMVTGDPYRLNQIMINLVGNAIKFTQMGTVEVNISLLTKDEHALVLKFEIEDTGIGIPQSKIETVFESFVQAFSNVSRKFGGTGLGLAITKELVTLKNGKIYLESKEGVGSKFTVELPFKVVDKEILQHRDTGDTSLPDISGVTVLIVEDNQLNQVLLKKILTDARVNHMIAENGQVALSILKEKNVDVVLMDLQMPVMDGIEATRHIRSKESATLNPDVPIIAVTADAFPETKNKVLASGMNDFITKPYKKEDIYSKIAMYL
ncbi:MAG TPA: ATP-binding protein [Flavipsychrobacter sp.]|nr:ATP-binding protein [Flavipsychrobacter sp.]